MDNYNHNANNNNDNDNNGYFRPVRMIGDDKNNGDPRNETIYQFIKFTCCPHFTFLSVVFCLSAVDLIIYVVTLCFGLEMDPTQLLAPKYSTLDKFGMKINYKIHNGQVWRWITFGLLHANLVHIVVNLCSQLIIGSFIENAIGHVKAGLLYLGSSIGGGVFSSLVSDSSGVGASVAIFGMLSAYFGYMILNWYYIDEIEGPRNKYCNLLFIAFIVIMNVGYGFSNDRIDNYGHIGGLIFGFFLSLVLIKPFNVNDGLCCKTKTWFIIGAITAGVLFVAFVLMFYLLKKY